MGLVVGLTMIAARHPLVSLFAMGDQSFGHDYLNGLRRDDLLLAGILLPQYLLCAGRGRVPLWRRYADGHDLRPCKPLGRRHPAGTAERAGADLSFLGVVILAYLGDDIPKSILCLDPF